MSYFNTTHERYIKIYLSNKSIALIGNSQSLLDSSNYSYGVKIDSYDIVCRINLGYITDKLKQGSKTDILFTSVPNQQIDIINKNFNPALILWATPKECPKHISEHRDSFKCPLPVWEELFNILGYRPSTGIIALNFLAVFLNLHVDIFGFDFFDTKTFYNHKKSDHPHEGESEKQFAFDLRHKGKIDIYTS